MHLVIRAPCRQAVLHVLVVQAAQALATTPSHNWPQAIDAPLVAQPAPAEL